MSGLEVEMNGLNDDLVLKFENKEYRHAYADDFLNSFIAAQLKALRDQRGWTQTELAGLSGMKQSRISAMENVNYSGWSVRTLARLAEAFDVALVVEFRSFGERLKDFSSFNPVNLRVPTFDEDPVVQRSIVPPKGPRRVRGSAAHSEVD